MEVIVLPYISISFFIGWAIFSPFARIDDLQQWTFARIETNDLLAIFLPLSYCSAFAKWLLSTHSVSVLTVTLIATAILLFSLYGFVTGLFLFAKMNQPNSFKRMAVIAILIPLGTLLTFAWIALPLLAYAGSIQYAIPATMAIVPATLVLRGISGWVCQHEAQRRFSN